MLTIETRRAARYCDEVCQRADYALQHKLECTTFARFPTTMAFQSEADTEEQFPQHPVFAHAHKGPMGHYRGPHRLRVRRNFGDMA